MTSVAVGTVQRVLAHGQIAPILTDLPSVEMPIGSSAWEVDGAPQAGDEEAHLIIRATLRRNLLVVAASAWTWSNRWAVTPTDGDLAKLPYPPMDGVAYTPKVYGMMVLTDRYNSGPLKLEGSGTVPTFVFLEGELEADQRKHHP